MNTQRTGHPIGDAIERQRKRERAIRECIRVFEKNCGSTSLPALRKIAEKEAFYGD